METDNDKIKAVVDDLLKNAEAGAAKQIRQLNDEALETLRHILGFKTADEVRAYFRGTEAGAKYALQIVESTVGLIRKTLGS